MQPLSHWPISAETLDLQITMSGHHIRHVSQGKNHGVFQGKVTFLCHRNAVERQALRSSPSRPREGIPLLARFIERVAHKSVCRERRSGTQVGEYPAYSYGQAAAQQPSSQNPPRNHVIPRKCRNLRPADHQEAEPTREYHH